MAQLGVALAAGAPWECCPIVPRVTSVTGTLSAAPLISLGRECPWSLRPIVAAAHSPTRVTRSTCVCKACTKRCKGGRHSWRSVALGSCVRSPGAGREEHCVFQRESVQFFFLPQHVRISSSFFNLCYNSV